MQGSGISSAASCAYISNGGKGQRAWTGRRGLLDKQSGPPSSMNSAPAEIQSLSQKSRLTIADSDCPLSELITAVQPRRRVWVFMPHCGHSQARFEVPTGWIVNRPLFRVGRRSMTVAKLTTASRRQRWFTLSFKASSGGEAAGPSHYRTLPTATKRSQKRTFNRREAGGRATSRYCVLTATEVSPRTTPPLSVKVTKTRLTPGDLATAALPVTKRRRRLGWRSAGYRWSRSVLVATGKPRSSGWSVRSRGSRAASPCQCWWRR